MTDAPTGAAEAVRDPVAVPIVVNGRPERDQAEALLRQVLSALGLIVAAFGLAKWAGVLGVLANLAGPIVTLIFGVVGLGAIVWGQVKTRVLSQKAAAMANKLDDAIAVAR